MYVNTDKVIAANKAGVEMVSFLAQTAFASAERVAALNLSSARSLFETGAANTKALFAAKSAQEMVALQKGFAKPALESAVAYSRGIYEILAETQQTFGQLFEGRVAELQGNVTAVLDQAAKNAPAGADVAIASVKSAIASANETLDNVKKSAKKAIELAEANVTAATDAALQTLKAA